jgi:hypothetical protein
MTQINWQFQVNNRAGGYIVTATDWNDYGSCFRSFIDQTTGSGTTDNVPLPIGLDLVNDRVYISDPDSATPENANHADTTLSVVGSSTFNGTMDLTSAVIQGASPLVFEGSSDNAHETTFAITDPTADRTITFKDGTGTVAFTSDISNQVAGSDHQVQFNDGGSFGADANFTYDGSATTLKATLTVGQDDTGHDVKFFGATSGKYMEWDESADQLDVTGSLDVTGNTSMTGTLTVGVDDTGHDVKFFGATSGKYFEWDESADMVKLHGSLRIANHDNVNFPNSTLICGSNDNVTPDANGDGHFVVDGNGYAGFISLDGDAMWLGHNTTSRALYFATNETMRTNITGASGYFYHGTTGGTDFPSTDGYMSVKSGDRVAFAIYRQASTTTHDLMYGYSDVGGTGTKNFQVECDGDVQNTYGNYTVLSDERLKENIVDPRDYYEDLRRLEVKNFNLCKRVVIDYDETEDGEIDLSTKQVSLVDNDPASRKKLLGLIAQDAEQIFPSLVKTGEDGYKSVSLTLLIPMLLQMCQKMADKIEALEGA